jgi:hypothetical protein
MGYKLLGMMVWKGGRMFLRRRFPGAPRKLAMAGAAGGVVAMGAAGAFVLARRASRAA